MTGNGAASCGRNAWRRDFRELTFVRPAAASSPPSTGAISSSTQTWRKARVAVASAAPTASGSRRPPICGPAPPPARRSISPAAAAIPGTPSTLLAAALAAITFGVTPCVSGAVAGRSTRRGTNEAGADPPDTWPRPRRHPLAHRPGEVHDGFAALFSQARARLLSARHKGQRARV